MCNITEFTHKTTLTIKAVAYPPLQKVVSRIWLNTASDGKAPVLELWGMLSTPYFLLNQGPLWSGLAAPVKVPSMGQIELFHDLLKIIIIGYLKQYSCVQIIHIT